MRLALFEPDIPQNAGTIMRLCACMGVALDVIEPCGFVMSDKNLKRAGMDYLDGLDMTRHQSWAAFKNSHNDKRLVLMTTKTEKSYFGFQFDESDILVAGRESAGVPREVHESCAGHVTIPMAAGMRSLNVAVASAMILGEAVRQTRMIRP